MTQAQHESHDVVVVGAGLAGLSAARELCHTGLDVVLLEASDGPGGRVRTDVVDGVRLDRGFQLLNPSYPRVRTALDLAALELCAFEAGAMVAHGETRHVVADPRRSPRDLARTLGFPLGTLGEKLRLVRWIAEIGFGPAARIKRQDDRSLAEELQARGLDGALTNGVLRPFLSGVLGEGEFRTSRRFAELLVRSFVRGTPGVPAQGMQAIPDQLAAGLPHGVLRLSTSVLTLSNNAQGIRVETALGRIAARAVVVAADPVVAADLLGHDVPAMNGLTTFYHLAGASPAARTLLHLDADHRGPVVNTAVMTDAAPTYAPGQALIASTVLGADGSGEMERRVRSHIATIYGPDTPAGDPAGWTHAGTYVIPHALPATPAGTSLRRPVELGDGLFVAGDHRDTASLQGALVSGHRVARAVRAGLR